MKLLYLLFTLLPLHLVVAAPNELPQSTECGVANPEYISNGKNITQLDEFPWMARIAYTTNEAVQPIYQCGAVLINERYLLTNANCFRFTAQPEAVILGDWNAANNISEVDCDESGRCAATPKYYDIEEIIIHYNYNRRTYSNNIALLRMNESVTFSDYIRPICLPSNLTERLQFDAPDHLQLSGWLKEAFGNIDDMKKSKMLVKVVPSEECSELYRLPQGRALRKIWNICAFTCAGKSKYLGSSALMGLARYEDEAPHYYLAGMVAFGRPECSFTYPDIFTGVERHIEWIKSNLYE